MDSTKLERYKQDYSVKASPNLEGLKAPPRLSERRRRDSQQATIPPLKEGQQPHFPKPSRANTITLTEDQISEIKKYRVVDRKSWDLIAEMTGLIAQTLRVKARAGLFGPEALQVTPERRQERRRQRGTQRLEYIESADGIAEIQGYRADGKPWQWIADKVGVAKTSLLDKAHDGFFGEALQSRKTTTRQRLRAGRS
jgi:hypothetical protein